MPHPEENGYGDEGSAEGVSGGITGLVASLAEAEQKRLAEEYKRLSALQDELIDPKNWCPKKVGELHGLLGKRVDHLQRELEAHPLRMDGSGRESRGELGQHIAYDLGLAEREKAMLAVALQHGHQHQETERARQAVQTHIHRWMSRRGC